MLLSVLAGMALAQVTVPASCRDDQGQDRCAPAKRAEARALYGVEPIEKLAASGTTVRRVIYVDGYGRDLVAIEFVRAAGADPSVRIHYPTPAKAERPGPLEAYLSATQWDSIVRGSRNIHRAFVPVAGGEPNICLHSWIYTVEAADPQDRAVPVRSRTDDACNDSPAEDFAMLGAQVALASLPHCGALDRDHFRNEATILAMCHRLKGDRYAAAELVNRIEGLTQLSVRPRGNLEKLTYYRLALDWQGQASRGEAAKSALTAKLSEVDRTFLFIDQIRGTSPSTGVLSGRLERDRNGGRGKPDVEVADIELRWDLQYASPITDVRVGSWRSRPLA